MTEGKSRTKEETEKYYRRTAVIVGALFITGTVTGMLSVPFLEPIRDDQNYLLAVSADQNQVIMGALLVLIMGLALAMIPVMMFPILRKHNEPLALGYVVFRGGLETFTIIVSAISSLLLVRLSEAYVQAGASDVSSLPALGELLRADGISTVSYVVFPLGALMLYYMLFQSRLVPRWISGWGIIAAFPYLAAPFLGVFDVIDLNSTAGTVLVLPMIPQEMVLAVWLIVKGFNPSAIVAGCAKVSE